MERRLEASAPTASKAAPRFGSRAARFDHPKPARRIFS
jgi:hypothetical protein